MKKKRAEEDALLAKYSKGGGKTLDERIAERQKESTERDRVPNAIKHFSIAIGCVVCSVIAFLVLGALENGGFAPRIVWLFVFTKGKYWVPVLLIGTAVYHCFLAFWYLNRKSNVDA